MWTATLEKLKLEVAKMPRDVRTRWNSTYDMLEFALRYRVAIDDITGNKVAGLRKYELDNTEWRIAQQLCDTLKVCAWIPLADALARFGTDVTATSLSDLQGCDAFLLALNAKSCHCDSSNGSHRRGPHHAVAGLKI
jgi:hypothetical protein